MSASAAIVDPRQLRLPSKLLRALDALTEADRASFATDLTEALVTAQRSGDLQAVQYTFLHWYQVARVRSGDPKLERIRQRAESFTPRDEDIMYTVEDARRYLLDRSS